MERLRRGVEDRQRFSAEEYGPTVTEYAVLLALIVFGVFAVIGLIGVFIMDSFTSVTTGLPES